MSGSKIIRMKAVLFFLFLIGFFISSCDKDNQRPLRYFQVGLDTSPADWRDSGFVVATSDPQLIRKIKEQLLKPTNKRQIVMGRLLPGSGGYNKNSGHHFGWHFKEDEWELVDVSAEIYDGRPYSDLDLHPEYWLDTLKRFSPWGSYIKREITGK